MNIFEAVMMICFGASWPASILKTCRVKNPAGKSLTFLWLIIIGYLAGIVYKLTTDPGDWVLWLYVLNTVMVGTDTFLVYCYRARLRRAEAVRK